MNSKWDVNDKELRIIESNGNTWVPSVEEIYAALVECKPTIFGIPTLVDNLSVSRYPLIPRLAIDLDSRGVPICSLNAIFKGMKYPIDISDLHRGHVILSRRWYPIDLPSAEEVSQLIRESGNNMGEVRSLRSFLQIRKAAALGGPVDDNTSNLPFSPSAFIPDSNELPNGVDAILYPYQLIGWRWLKFLISEGYGGLLSDEMGLGKTLQIIATLSDAGSGILKPTLIVAPGSILENWRREIAKFAPSLNVMKHHGSNRVSRPVDLAGYDVVITSYDLVIGDNSLLNMIRWKVIVLDEAQFIRNPNAKRTKAVKHLNRVAGLAVTGTPMENRMLDVWSILDFVYPGYLGDAKSFERQFLNTPTGAAQLERIISPLMLRRRVGEVANDLPERIEIPQFLELGPDEAVAYEAERKRIYNEYGSSASLVALTSLRRFCAHPSLIMNTLNISDPMTFTKFRRLDEILEEIYELGEKALVFTSFTNMADIIATHVVKRYGVFVGVVDGRISIIDRQPMIDEFASVSGGATLVLNPKAGGSGLNIVAANHVIHYNPEWNPALQDQASARAHRRGQQLPVTIHRLLIADTVEEVVNDRLTRKKTLSNAAIVGVEGNDQDYRDIVSALSRTPVLKELA